MQQNHSFTPETVTVLACDVLRDEVKAAAQHATTHALDLRFVEQGLHNEPNRLRGELQVAIDEVEQGPGDAIVLVYGLCCRGTEGIRSSTRPLIIPRAHDCITLLLGCRHKYAEQVKKEPGTYWYSPGWNRCHVPPGRERTELLRRQYEKEYGEDNAEYLMTLEQSWLEHYNRAAYVHLEKTTPKEDRRFTKDCAEFLGWNYDEISGDPSLLRDLLTGPWDEDRFVVLQPGQVLRVTSDERVIEAADPDSEP